MSITLEIYEWIDNDNTLIHNALQDGVLLTVSHVQCTTTKGPVDEEGKGKEQCVTKATVVVDFIQREGVLVNHVQTPGGC